MAKVFTIAQGLENMGALKTGGQGSIYKGKRIGEIITAVKLLPTPIHKESNEDKNYRDFQNEVHKLQEVNKTPNPNVVKMLSWGLSETGNFPFIEMEYIDGPDLEELLTPPLDQLFTIKEVIKVAEQLSNALAHCHKHDVKHGDIKSNNIKLNLNTGNYVLLDFGLAIMNDEQRRTSLRKAGAVEFMAPEQDNGDMLFQTDVYSFGIVIYELLAGTVPFPLMDKNESARNTVRLAHMETVPPDILKLRKSALPISWSQDKKEREMLVPDWLLTLAYTCLRKKPETRFANGMELHDFIMYHSTQLNASLLGTPNFGKLNSDIEKEQLKQQIVQYKQQIQLLQKENEQLKSVKFSDTTWQPHLNKESNVSTMNIDSSENYTDKNRFSSSGNNKVADNSQKWLVIILVAVLAGSLYFANQMFNKPTTNNLSLNDTANNSVQSDTATYQNITDAEKNDSKEKVELLRQKKADTLKTLLLSKMAQQRMQDSLTKIKKDSLNVVNNSNPNNTDPKPLNTDAKPMTDVQYMVIRKAYFYTAPDETTRRNVYVEPSNNAIVNVEEEQGDFVHVSFINTKGQPSKGWLRKADLQRVND